jgi:hypothetical protein
MKTQKHNGHSDPDPSGKDWRPGSPGVRSATHPKEVQPGTAQKGESWHSDRPDPDDEDDKLEKALEDSFPASDPPQPAQPGVTGWDVSDDTAEKAGKG